MVHRQLEGIGRRKKQHWWLEYDLIVVLEATSEGYQSGSVRSGCYGSCQWSGH